MRSLINDTAVESNCPSTLTPWRVAITIAKIMPRPRFMATVPVPYALASRLTFDLWEHPGTQYCDQSSTDIRAFCFTDTKFARSALRPSLEPGVALKMREKAVFHTRTRTACEPSIFNIAPMRRLTGAEDCPAPQQPGAGDIHQHGIQAICSNRQNNPKKLTLRTVRHVGSRFQVRSVY